MLIGAPLTPLRIEKTVFISYRRANTAYARLVYKELTHAGYDAFFDYTSIDSGSFERIIFSQIPARAHFLLILTPSTLERCIDPTDWVRREIECAIDHQRNIVPIAFDGFEWNRTQQEYLVGERMNLLPSYQYLEVPWSYFDEAMERLQSIQYLNRPLDTVLHPVTLKEQQIVEQQQKAIEADPKASEYKLKSLLHYERGVAWFDNGQIDRALNEFTESIEYDYSNAQAYYSRAIANFRNGSYEEAANDWRNAVRFGANEPNIMLMRSQLSYFVEHDYAKALIEIDLAIEQTPDDPAIYTHEGIMLKSMGEYGAAIESFTLAINICSSSSTASFNRDGAHSGYFNAHLLAAYAQRAGSYAELSEFDRALEDIETALRVRPDDEDFLNIKERILALRASEDALQFLLDRINEEDEEDT